VFLDVFHRLMFLKNTTFRKHCAPAVGELCVVGVSHLASIPCFMDGYFESCLIYLFSSPFCLHFRSLYHHHHRLDSPTSVLAFLRSFCQLKYSAIASPDFMTRVFSRVVVSARRPPPGCPGGPMFSVSVVSLSRLFPILKCQDLVFFPCMT
jgi:hypothetical protein